MKTSLRFASVISMLAIISVSIFAQSQATTGLIQGNVVDPNGAAVSGASCRATA